MIFVAESEQNAKGETIGLLVTCLDAPADDDQVMIDLASCGFKKDERFLKYERTRYVVHLPKATAVWDAEMICRVFGIEVKRIDMVPRHIERRVTRQYGTRIPRGYDFGVR